MRRGRVRLPAMCGIAGIIGSRAALRRSTPCRSFYGTAGRTARVFGVRPGWCSVTAGCPSWTSRREATSRWCSRPRTDIQRRDLQPRTAACDATRTLAFQRRHRSAGAPSGAAGQRLSRARDRHVCIRAWDTRARACCWRETASASSRSTTGSCRTASPLRRNSSRCCCSVNPPSTTARCAIFFFTAMCPHRRRFIWASPSCPQATR